MVPGHVGVRRAGHRRAGRRHGVPRGARCWPTCPRRRSTATWSGRTLPAGCAAASPVPVGRPDAQGRLGARRPSRGPRPGRAAPAPCTSASTSTASSTSPPISPWDGSRAALRAPRPDDHRRPDPVTGGYRIRLGVHASAQRLDADEETLDEQVRRVEETSSGWRRLRRHVIARHVQTPADLHATTPTSAGAPPRRHRVDHQQLSFVPPGSARDGPRLRSSGCTSRAHPRIRAAAFTAPAAGTPPCSALRHRGPLGMVRRAMVRTAWSRVLREPVLAAEAVSSGVQFPASHSRWRPSAM